MKLVCLNTEGGKTFNLLIEFIKKQSGDADIFCFQEIFQPEDSREMNADVRANLYREIGVILPNFQGFFAPQVNNYNINEFVHSSLIFGPSIFIRKSIEVINHGETIIYGERNKLIPHDDKFFPPGFLQYVNLKINEKPLIICNVHGFAGWPKSDTPDRIKQSQKILDFLKTNGNLSRIICGDFNLFFDTESIAMLSASHENLIKKYGILHTRGPLFKGAEDEISDYIFTSPDIKLKNFQVPWVGISDHLPLILEFDI